MKKTSLIFALLLLVSPVFAVDYDITAFGAKARENFLNTECIQKAIDLCSEEGGGRVVIPRGTFVSGTIELKNGVTLHLEHGATLLGSTRREDYSKHLVRALGAKNIGISGHGTIDGSGSAFWYVKDNGHYDHDRPVPGYMIYLEDCKDVNIQDVHLQNAESWTLHLLGCSEVMVRGVTIRNPLHGPNNDGIDIQACQSVIISDCDIYTSDDAIVLKNRHPKYYGRMCSNIAVTNCVITCVCNALKIGTETIGDFRNITFSNCTIRSARKSDELAKVRLEEVKMPIRAISGISIESVDGSNIYGVTISNIVMEDVRVPIFIRLANRGAGTQKVKPTQPGTIRNVLISNVTARHAWFASSITAIPGSYVENVSLNNIVVRTAGKGDAALAEKAVDEKIDSYPDAHMWNKLPASAFYIRHVKDLEMNGIRCSLDSPDERPLYIFDDAKDLTVSNCSSDDNSVGKASIRLVNVENAWFSNLRLSEAAENIIELRGENEGLQLVGVNQNKVK